MKSIMKWPSPAGRYCLRTLKVTALICQLFLSSRICAQVWSPAGNTDDNWPSFNYASKPSVSFDQLGNVFVAYADEGSKLAVRQWSNNSWSYVGGATASPGSMDNPSLAIDTNNTLYVGFIDIPNAGKVSVKKFVNNAWTNVGTPGFSQGSPAMAKMKLDKNGNPWVVYLDNSIGGKLTVQRFNNSNWSIVGIAGFTPGNTQYFDFDFDTSNTPYVAFQDASLSNKISVRKFVNNAWTGVGAAGYSTNNINGVSIAFDTLNRPITAYTQFGAAGVIVKHLDSLGAWVDYGTSQPYSPSTGENVRILMYNKVLYLSYKDYYAGNKPNIVKYQNAAWTPVGPTFFSIQSASDPDFAISKTGNIVSAYTEGAMNSKLSVRKLTGNSWNFLGDQGFSKANPGGNSLSIDNLGTPYAAYREPANSNTVTLKKFSNNTWITIDTAAAPYNSNAINVAAWRSDTVYLAYWDYSSSYVVAKRYVNGVAAMVGSTVSPNPASGACMSLDTSGVPYVLYNDNANSGKLTARKFAQGSWVNVGSPISPFSTGSTVFKINSKNIPYVAYGDGTSGLAPLVKKFDGTNWVAVGSGPLSSGQSNTIAIDFDTAGTPFVAFYDNVYNGRLTVKKFNGNSWVTIGTGGISTGAVVYANIIIDKYGYPYVAYQDNGEQGKLVVKRFDGSNWVTAGAATLSPGLATEIKMVNDRSTNNTTLIYANGQNYGKRANFTICYPPALSYTKSDVSCNGFNNGSINVTATGGSGPTSYAWTGPNNFNAATTSVANLAPGSYNLVATTNVYGGCTNSVAVNISEPQALTAVSTHATPCPGGSLSLSVTGAGGRPAYTYLWSGPGGYASTLASPVRTGATSAFNGNYIVKVTDTSSCVAFDTTAVDIATVPAIQASSLLFTSVTSNSMKVTFNRGSGNKGTIVVAGEVSPLTGVPQCGSSYNAPATSTVYFDADSLFSTIGNGKVIYKSTSASSGAKTFTLKNLSQATRYYFRIYEYDSTAAYGTVYLTSPSFGGDTVTGVTAPNIAAKNVVFENISEYGATVRCTKGNGMKRLIVIKSLNSINASPADGVIYNASAAYGSGDTINAAAYTGTHYVVYNGTDSVVTISNLLPGVKYNVAVFEYNGQGALSDYATSSLKGSFTTLKDYIEFVAAGKPLSQNFDTFSTSTNQLPAGWYASGNITANTGASSAVGIKNYGGSGSAERALGSLGAGKFGMKLVNKSSLPVTSLLLMYRGEQWRKGGGGIPDSLVMEYATNAYNLTSTNQYLSTAQADWSKVDELSFGSVQSGSSASLLNGNLAANSADIQASITGINLLPGDDIWIRWSDKNLSTNDGLAIDDITVVPFSNTVINGGILNKTTIPDLNIVSGTAVMDSVVKLTISNALNIGTNAVLDMSGVVKPSLTISSYVFGDGMISAPNANDATVTVGGTGLKQTLYFKPGFNTINTLTVKGDAEAALGNTLNIAALPKAGSVKVGASGETAILNTNGNLVLNSDTTGTAAIAAIFGTINGNVAVERAISSKNAYKLLAHPFNAPVSLSQLSDDYPGLISQGAYYHNAGTAPGAGNIQALGTNAGWTKYTTTSQSVAPYAVMRMYKKNGANADTLWGDALNINMSGTINQGDISIPLNSGNDSFIAIGNPYPAGLELTDAITTAAAAGYINGSYIYTWDQSKAKTTGAWTVIPSSKFNTAKVPICGAFIVAKDPASATGNLLFSEADKTTTGNTKAAFRGAEASPEGFALHLTDDQNPVDELYLYFDQHAKSYEEVYDAPKLRNPGVSLFAKSSNGKDLAIDTRPYLDGSSISLGLSNIPAGTYAFHTDDWNLAAGQSVYLEDHLLGTVTQLSAKKVYPFQVSATGAADISGRFNLRMGPAASVLTGNDYSVTLLPNPAIEEVNIGINGSLASEASIRIFTAAGQLMTAQKLIIEHGSSNITIGIKEWPAGIYYVETTIDNAVMSKKLIKR